MKKNNSPETCFSTTNWEKAKKLIDFRISVSGMGKFYVTYPPEENKINDGVKRLPKNPEDVYDVYEAFGGGVIVFKSPKHEFRFDKNQGLLDASETDKSLAQKVFCYLVK
ncbi:MAG: hypothetical protein AB8F74_10600 [Saprospiraceae bacterium]